MPSLNVEIGLPGAARKEPTIAGAIELATRLLERLHSLDGVLAGTLERMRGPVAVEGAEGKADYPKAGLLEDLDRALGEAGAVVSVLGSRADEIERLVAGAAVEEVE